jgi:hypothetical protein
LTWHRRFGVNADGAAHCAFLKADALPLKADALPLKADALPLSED